MRHLSFANVISCVALFVALGGTSYAIVKVPRNSVGSREVKNRSLKAVDLASGAIQGARGARGPQGPAGPAGERGPADVVTANRNKIFMALGGPTSVDAVTITLPAGSWSVTGSASIVQFGQADFFRCSIAFGDDKGSSGSVARVGTDAGATTAAILTVQEGRVLSAPTAVRLRCGHDNGLPGGDPRVDHAQLTAVRTGALDVQAG